MANNVIKRVWNQNRMVAIEDLKGMTFQAESGGHTFQISGVDDAGNTVALSGSVAGVFLRPDNTDVAITGSASGGVVSVTLPANCYDVPGRFGLTVFVTANGQKTAVYAAMGTVSRTSSGAVSPGTTSDVVDLINRINAAVATIPASWTGLMADIAPTYSDAAVYPVGAYVYYNGDLYRCTTAITTAESWTAGHWTQAVLGNDVSDLKSAFVNYTTQYKYSFLPKVYDGKYINTSGTQSSASGSSASDKIYVRPGDYIILKNAFMQGGRCIAGYNANSTKEWYINTGDTVPKDYIMIVPDGTNYIQYTVQTSDQAEIIVCKHENEYETIKQKKLKTDYTFTDQFVTHNSSGGSTVNADGSITVATSGYIFRRIDISKLPHTGNVYITGKLSRTTIKDQLTYAITSSNTTDIRPFTLNGSFFSVIIDMDQLNNDSLQYLMLRFDNRSDNSGPFTVTELDVFTDMAIGNERACYVSTTGNDGDEGNEQTPLATITEAIKRGYSKILIYGGVYKQQITMPNAGKVSIAPKEINQKVIIYAPDSLLSDSETKVAEKTKVYSATITATIDNDLKWIYQDDVPDATTLIEEADRLPQQRGKQHRCNDTKIVRCTSTVLADALDEIDASDEYKWFVDGTTLYFSRPSSVSSSYPICASMGTNLFNYTGTNRQTIEITGIEFKYFVVNITNTVNSKIVECKSSNAFGAGCFSYDNSIGVSFIQCEAEHAQIGTVGDGFNGHSNNSGEVYARQTIALLQDCWSHDNCDDGFSDHEKCESVIRGGLFEHNGKAGVTPSYGAHCSCYDVISRNNYAGFFYTGEAIDSGKYGQLLCVNCVALDNSGGSVNAGFCVYGSGNRAELINCKAIANRFGYRTQGGTYMRIIDCTAKDNTEAVKYGNGNVTVENTGPVT